MARLATAEKENIQNTTRSTLLEAATAEFASLGFAGANINRISLAAGFAKGTIYNYFPSKRDLMLALIDQIGADHTNFIVGQVILRDDPVERVQTFFSAGFRFVEENPNQAQIAISAVYGFDAEFKERIYDAYQELFTLLIEDVVGLGITQGEFDTENPNTVAAMLMSIYLGGSSLYDPEGGIWFDSEKVTAFVLDGIRKTGSVESETKNG
jgi:AcrR family transcriptional regulator